MVKLGSHLSTLVPVISGVPQGSVLGQLLFLLFTNDIEKNVNLGTDIKLFADDIKLHTEISLSFDNTNLQSQRNNTQSWNEWQDMDPCTWFEAGMSSDIQH